MAATIFIRLSRVLGSAYTVNMQVERTGDAAGQTPAVGEVTFDFDRLRATAPNPDRHGQLLTGALFADEAVKSYFGQAWAAAEGKPRLVLQIDPSAEDLHALRWETLCHPVSGERLTSDANRPFSRFLASENWEQVVLRPKSQLRALVVVANPRELKDGLQLLASTMYEVDVPGELERARDGLREAARIEELVSPTDQPGEVTFERLTARLLEGYDIVYLVCHGALLPENQGDEDERQTPFILLENADGSYDRRDATQLANFIAQLRAERRPRLVVLSSCQSGGTGIVPSIPASAEQRSYDGGALAALGPRLAQAGVPAVVAMQDNVKMRTVARFMPVFFQELLREGYVDRAMAVARNVIGGQPDWWVPLLYSRLRDGQLWLADEGLSPAESRIRSAIGTYAEDFFPRTRQQAERFINAFQGAVGQHKVFIPEVYVRRKAVEDQLDQFVNSREPAVVMTGAPGVGKTSLLCRWVQDLLAAEQGVLAYDCAAFLDLEIEEVLVADLGLTDNEDLLPALNRVAEITRASDKQVVLIFNDLNGYRGDQQTGPYDLLRKIDALVRNPRFPTTGVRVLISCSTPAWSYMEKHDTRFLEWVYHPPYFQPGTGRGLRLEVFTDQEFEIAYRAYQQHFQLQTPFEELPQALRGRLRTPDLLRMLAETYQGRPEPIAYEAQALSIFRRYYEQHVRQPGDRLLVDKLVGEMYRRRRASLPLMNLARDDQFRADFAADDWGSSYQRLLEQGVLAETEMPLIGETVSFTHSRFGAFALASHIYLSESITASLLQRLVDESSDFSMVWDAAITLLTLGKDDTALFLSCATSSNVALRELVTLTLVELYVDEPAAAVELIKVLLGSGSREAERCGLKAAYWIGPGAREVFLWAVRRGSAELRGSTEETLYLIWRQDPDFTYGLLNELADRFGLSALSSLRKTLEFLIHLSITIYINHPEQEDIVRQTTDLWYKILIERLHLNLFRTDILGRRVERVLFQIVGRAFSHQLMKTALFTDYVPVDRVFDLSESERECFKQSVILVDPQTDIHDHVDDLQALLDSDIVLFNLLAAMVLAIHAFCDFGAHQALLEEIWDRLTPQGKAWELMGFAVLLPDAPPEWMGLLEVFTRHLFEEHPGVIYGDEMPLIKDFDIIMLPLALSYGKWDDDMTYYVELLRDGSARADHRLVRRSLAGLGLAGFYYPRATFQTLAAGIPDFNDPEIQVELIRSLATIRTLHLDQVDSFLIQIGMDEAFRRRVSAATDVALVRRYLYPLGIYNNAVHQAIHYPIMRRELLINGLTALADSHRPHDFIASYTPAPMRLLREADYRLDRWTLPE